MLQRLLLLSEICLIATGSMLPRRVLSYVLHLKCCRPRWLLPRLLLPRPTCGNAQVTPRNTADITWYMLCHLDCLHASVFPSFLTISRDSTDALVLAQLVCASRSHKSSSHSNHTSDPVVLTMGPADPGGWGHFVGQFICLRPRCQQKWQGITATCIVADILVPHRNTVILSQFRLHCTTPLRRRQLFMQSGVGSSGPT